MVRKVSTTAGSKCVPAQRLISARAVSNEIAREYGRSKVMASSASASAKIRGPSGICLAAESRGVARAVPPLVVVVDDGDGAAQERDLLDQPATDLGVRAHHRPLLRRERTRLEEDGVGNADLADVVEQHAVLDVGHLGFGHTVGAGDGERVAAHAARVGVRADVARVDGRAERLEGDQVRLFEVAHGGGELARRFRHPPLQQLLVLAALDDELAPLERAAGGDEAAVPDPPASG